MNVTSPCPYARHRPSDHIAAGGTGPLICGICHPPTYADPVRRGEPGFDELLAAAIAREVPGPPRCEVCRKRTESGESGLCKKHQAELEEAAAA